MANTKKLPRKFDLCYDVKTEKDVKRKLNQLRRTTIQSKIDWLVLREWAIESKIDLRGIKQYFHKL